MDGISEGEVASTVDEDEEKEMLALWYLCTIPNTINNSVKDNSKDTNK